MQSDARDKSARVSSDRIPFYISKDYHLSFFLPLSTNTAAVSSRCTHTAMRGTLLCLARAEMLVSNG